MLKWTTRYEPRSEAAALVESEAGAIIGTDRETIIHKAEKLQNAYGNAAYFPSLGGNDNFSQ